VIDCKDWTPAGSNAGNCAQGLHPRPSLGTCLRCEHRAAKGLPNALTAERLHASYAARPKQPPIPRHFSVDRLRACTACADADCPMKHLKPCERAAKLKLPGMCCPLNKWLPERDPTCDT